MMLPRLALSRDLPRLLSQPLTLLLLLLPHMPLPQLLLLLLLLPHTLLLQPSLLLQLLLVLMLLPQPEMLSSPPSSSTQDTPPSTELTKLFKFLMLLPCFCVLN